jgi:uncharacterized protein (TIGR03435 family)
MRVCLGVLLFALLAYPVPIAQQPSTTSPTFEVASVKRNVSGRIGGAIRVPPAGQLTYTNVPLRVLIRDAYQLDPYKESSILIAGPFERLIGRSSGPPEPDVPRWDVQAKPPDGTLPAERRAMMRALLEERFKLRVHREMRQSPAYALTVARAGRLGPNLVASKFDCEAYLAQRRAGGTAPEPVNESGESWCLFPISNPIPGARAIRMAGPLKLLIERVTPWVERPIVDATGLTGNYEWVLTLAAGPEAPADVPRIFDAIRAQLGLNLERREVPLEVLVVDHVELATSD